MNANYSSRPSPADRHANTTRLRPNSRVRTGKRKSSDSSCECSNITEASSRNIQSGTVIRSNTEDTFGCFVDSNGMSADTTATAHRPRVSLVSTDTTFSRRQQHLPDMTHYSGNSSTETLFGQMPTSASEADNLEQKVKRIRVKEPDPASVVSPPPHPLADLVLNMIEQFYQRAAKYFCQESVGVDHCRTATRSKHFPADVQKDAKNRQSPTSTAACTFKEPLGDSVHSVHNITELYQSLGLFQNVSHPLSQYFSSTDGAKKIAFVTAAILGFAKVRQQPCVQSIFSSITIVLLRARPYITSLIGVHDIGRRGHRSSYGCFKLTGKCWQRLLCKLYSLRL